MTSDNQGESVSIDEFKARAEDLLGRLTGSGDALVLTRDGEPAAIVVSPSTFEALTERARFIARYERGLADCEAGRLTDHEAVVAEMRKEFGLADDAAS